MKRYVLDSFALIVYSGEKSGTNTLPNFRTKNCCNKNCIMQLRCLKNNLKISEITLIELRNFHF